jgi:carbonic anhydrase
MVRRIVLACAVTLVAAACGTGPASPPEGSAPAQGPRASTRPSAAPDEGDPEWHYEGHEGPEHWAELNPRFAACRDGRAQSPIDITLPVARGVASALKLQFPAATLRIAHHEHVADGINNGHTIQVNYDDGDTLLLGETAYGLVQYHFHNPSEHTLSGRRFPMEMHMVHRSAMGQLAVVGVLIEEGWHNRAFEPVWANLPRTKGVETHYEHVKVDVDALLPAVRTSYRYDGSLTTPPCTEGVKWIVLTMPIELDPEQIRAFTDLIHDNSRPVQPLNGRTVGADIVALTGR